MQVHSAIFIRPFEKRTYYAVTMSVRPSVRPRFPDFSSTCFQISIWNLVYTFSRWHDMSSLSCITIGSLWPSLQPKVINQDKFFKFGTQVACCILLDNSSAFCKNIFFGILAIIFARFGFFEVFRDFFLHVLIYQFETWYIYAVGGVTCRVRVSFQSGHFDLLYSQK